MMKKNQLFFLLFFCSLTIFSQVPQALADFLSIKNLANASVSLKAIDLGSEKIIASFNEKKSLTPASNMKIVTTATALEIYGGNFFYETHLLYDGFIQDATLNGNIYIKGNGDPTLGSEFSTVNKDNFLKEWLLALNREGIRKIKGNIFVLDQLFGYNGVSPKWLVEDLGTHYAPGIYGISIFDNMYRVYLQSSDLGSAVKILYTEPKINDLYFINEIKVSYDSSDDASAFGVPFSNIMRLYGTIPAYQSSFAVKGAIPDPGLFLSKYFYDFLKENGISTEGEATTYRLNPVTPSGLKLLSSIRSVDLASIVQIINVKSNNLYAEYLYKLLTVLDSVDIQNYWKDKGFDADALFMFDGSGISPQNAISSGFLIDLLVYMYKKSPNSNAFFQSFPVAGKNGTVASFLKNTSLNGKVRLKTGSITNVQSYSGYVENNGKRYAVSLIINNFTGKRNELQKEIERLFVRLF